MLRADVETLAAELKAGDQPLTGVGHEQAGSSRSLAPYLLYVLTAKRRNRRQGGQATPVQATPFVELKISRSAGDET